ncbi:hypothetical protein PB2503_01892 [Parvularcula bermudensis HTCC2503]|uniref:histidine kinase n=2 Tax=Parvularcula TaxID=208215 RepID=E0TBW4_PARBH|nr:hypothetical protein PB2503_01892 [Parvularcula bermudensis HTCC2503]
MHAGFGLMTLLTVSYAVWSIHALDRSSRIVRQTYDHSLMAINYARAAEANTARFLLSDRHDDEMLMTVVSDLAIVVDRSEGPSRDEASAIRDTIAGWREGNTPDNAADWSEQAFDLLTELLAADSFIEREKAIAAADRSTRLAMIGMVLVALLSLLLAAGLNRLIVTPLKALEVAARKIAAGAYDSSLPKVVGIELIALVTSMRVMQRKIARRIAEELEGRQRAETRLEAIIREAADAILILDKAGRIQMVNDAAQALLPEASMGRGERLTDLLAATSIDPNIILTLNEGGETRLPNGVWVNAAAPHTNDEGRILVWSDITAIKAREEDLSAANEAKTRFMAVTTHELRTPLNAVIGFSQLMRDEAFGPLGDESYQQFAREIFEAGNTLLGLVDDILRFSDAQNTDYYADLELVAPAPLFHALCEGVRYDEHYTSLTLETIIDDTLQEIRAKPSHLTSALRHLLINAGQFSDEGGLVSFIAKDCGDTVVVTIKDRGKGMSAEALERALELFGQADNSRTRHHEGMGLGLPLARTIVLSHRGTFDIESLAGEGTTITIILPYAEGEMAEDTPLTRSLASA